MACASHVMKCIRALLSLLLCVTSVYGNSKQDSIQYFHLGDDDTLVKSHTTPPSEWTARAVYNNSYLRTGWAYLEVETNPAVDDVSQAFGAGFIEGYLTKELILSHWNNVAKDLCKTIPSTCEKIHLYYKENINYITDMINKLSKMSPYWHHVHLYLKQMQGVAAGYQEASRNSSNILNYEDIFKMNMLWDMTTLIDVFSKGSERKEILKFTRDRCSALIKLTPLQDDLLVGHTTWTKYSDMIRILKKYTLHFHMIPEAKRVIPGKVMTFTSYPGALVSGDDFSIMSSGLVTMETTNSIFNADLYKYVDPTKAVPEAIRSTVANRLAVSAVDWRDYFVRYNSGTYNNQWMVIDYKKFPLRPEDNKMNLVWIVEQMPGLEFSEDITYNLCNTSYWASYNIPFIEYLYNVTGYREKSQQFGDWYTYDKSPRAQIFARDHHKATNVDTLLSLLRYNDYRNDPLSACKNCTPTQNACYAPAARCELNPVDGSYPFWLISHRMHGSIDGKAVDSSLVKKLQLLAVSGPPAGPGVPVFDWKNFEDEDDSPHIGHPDVFDFLPEIHNWSL